MGKKPLYYAQRDGAFLFGSELKALLASGRISKRVDPQAFSHYLSTLVVPAPWSIFQDAKKLEPGHFVEVGHTTFAIRQYRRVAGWCDSATPDYADACIETRRLLLAAVEKRLATEVPFGAFLSGGIDSGVVVALMTHLLRQPVKTYSIGFDGPASHDESAAARATATHVRSHHTEIRVAPDVLSLIPDLVRLTDEPFAVSSSIPLLLLSRAAAKHVKVVLTGDGGDEVFGGYQHYRYERFAAAWRRAPKGIDATTMALARMRGKALSTKVERFIAAARTTTPGERRLRWGSAFGEAEKARLFDLPDGLSSTASFLSSSARSAARPDAASQLIDLNVFLQDEMLCKVDRATMGSSLEARSPLLDDDLAKFVLSIDLRMKTRFVGRTKRLLVDAVRDLLPKHLVHRKKWGFNMPLDAWLRTTARAEVERLLAPPRLERIPFLRVSAVQGFLDAHFDGRINAANRIFALLTLQAWAETNLPA